MLEAVISPEVRRRAPSQRRPRIAFTVELLTLVRDLLGLHVEALVELAAQDLWRSGDPGSLLEIGGDEPAAGQDLPLFVREPLRRPKALVCRSPDRPAGAEPARHGLGEGLDLRPLLGGRDGLGDDGIERSRIRARSPGLW